MRCTAPLILVALTCLQAGCNQLGRSRFAKMLPPAGENVAAHGGTSDPWITAAAEEARPNLQRETVPDPLGVRKWFTTPESREIERNLGIE